MALQRTFSTEKTRPLQQGDIFLTSGVVRVICANSVFTPPAWVDFDQRQSQLAQAHPSMEGLDSIGGRALVMVLSHDCQLDKEINSFVRLQMKVNKDLSEEEAFVLAEANDDLDRYVVVSPLVDLNLLSASRNDDAKADLLSGRTVGYFPIDDEPELGLADTVVDLSYRATVDRLSLTRRLVSLSDPARLQLRYALARMDSLRTPDLNSDFANAVGQKIISIDLPKRGSQIIRLILENGTGLEVLPKPGNTAQGGPARRDVRKKDRSA